MNYCRGDQDFTCTVKELRELLNQFNDDEQIYIGAYLYGYDELGCEMWISETPICADNKKSMFQ